MTKPSRKTTTELANGRAMAATPRVARPKKTGKLGKDPIAVAEPSGNLLARGAWFSKRRRSA